MFRPLALFMFLSLLTPQIAEAIPVFARTYGVPCSTCHTTITRRNEFGDAFRRSGYRWPFQAGEELNARKDEPVKTSTTGYPGSIWSMLLPEQLPLAIAANFSLAFTSKDSEDGGTGIFADTDIVAGSPSLTLLLGGSLGKRFGFFGTWAGQGAPNELHLTYRAMEYEDLFVTLKAGLFEQNTTLLKNNEALLAPFLHARALNGHAVAKSRLGVEGNAMFLDGRMFVALGGVQNGGLDSPFDGYVSAAYRFGGLSFGGEEPDIDLDEESIFDTLSVTISAWGYLGGSNDTAGQRAADIRRFGADARIEWGNLLLLGSFARGFDIDVPTGYRSRSLTIIGEASYGIYPWLRPMYLFQYLDSSRQDREYRQHDFGFLILLADNIRVKARFQYSEDQINNEVIDLQALVGF